MDRETVQAKLDNLVESKNIYDANIKISSEISTCRQLDSGIHIHYGIEELAEIMGFELKEIIHQGSSFPYQYQFIYRNVPFYQISEKRFKGYGDTE